MRNDKNTKKLYLFGNIPKNMNRPSKLFLKENKPHFEKNIKQKIRSISGKNWQDINFSRKTPIIPACKHSGIKKIVDLDICTLIYSKIMVTIRSMIYLHALVYIQV